MNRYLLLAVFFALVACQETSKHFSALPNFVLPETALVLKTDDLHAFSKRLSQHSFFAETDFFVQKNLQQKLAALNFLYPQDESLLCFSMIGRDVFYTFITENRASLLPTDSLPNKMVESFSYDGQTVKKYTLDGKVLYAAVLNGVFVGSGSQLIVENVIRLFNLGLEQNVHFKSTYEASSADASLFVHNENFQQFFEHFFPKGNASFLEHFSGWTALDIEAETNALFLNGVVMDQPETSNILGFFKGNEAQENQLAQVVPLNATGFYAFTYSDFSRLREKLPQENPTALPKKLDGLFASAREIGTIYFPEGKAVVLNSHNLEQTNAALLSQLEVADAFREQAIYHFSETDVFRQAFSPLIQTKNLRYYTRLDHFFVFSEKMELLQNIIAHFQNRSVLAQQAYFEATAENLSDEASILLMGLNEQLAQNLTQNATEKYRDEIAQLEMKNYPLSAMQFVRGEGFSHVNLVFQKNTGEREQNGTEQLLAMELENPLAGPPQFFEYWRTGEQYLVAQDEKNTLYLFDPSGELRWKKQLDGRILGAIQPVDLFKNTRLQMAFVTPGKFYVVDRLGSDVEGFPIDFNDPITQALSVFDYAGSRDYRFVITQNKTVLMLDRNAKTVQGFEFEAAQTPILQAPKHLRIGRKDYILIPEQSGKLHILSRQGKARVKVKQNIDFSDNEWFLHKGKFTSTNAEGNWVQIAENGSVSTKELELSDNHHLAISGTVVATLSENILTINGTELELDYGLYTAPKIFTIQGKTYVNVTDTQASKVYLFNGTGKLLPGFPVYGNSAIDLGNLDNEGKLEFVVKGEDDSVLVYRVD